MKIRKLNHSEKDLLLLFDHHQRHFNESGRDGNLIFSPYENYEDETENEGHDEFIKKKIEREKKSHTQLDWERTWILTDEEIIKGEIVLRPMLNTKSSLHRSMLMMGIEQNYRNKGFGKKLIQSALAWASDQKELEWINLNVFSQNLPAIKLYQKFGFSKIGENKDLFRLFGSEIGNIEMSLQIPH